MDLLLSENIEELDAKLLSELGKAYNNNGEHEKENYPSLFEQCFEYMNLKNKKIEEIIVLAKAQNENIKF